MINSLYRSLWAGFGLTLTTLALGLAAGTAAIAQIEPTYPSFLDWLRGGGDAPPESRGTSTITRGGGPCLVSPYVSFDYPVAQVYRPHPTFVLQGAYSGLSVATREQPEQSLWTYPAGDGLTLPHYDQMALTASDRYSLTITTAGSGTLQVMFERLPEAERQAITQELAVLEQEAKADRATTTDIALQRANYFWQRGLAVDAWSELAAIADSSVTAQTAMTTAIERLCP